MPDITVDQRVPATGRAAPGSVHLVGSDNVDPALVGATCDVNVNLANNQSVHPNSDLLITSGSSTVVALDVERDADAIIDTTPGTLTLEADTVTVSVRLGPDGLFSGGFTISFACTPPAAADDNRPADDGHADHDPPLRRTPRSRRRRASPVCQPAGSDASGSKAANGQSELRRHPPAHRTEQRRRTRCRSRESHRRPRLCSPESGVIDHGQSIDRRRLTIVELGVE